MNELALSIRKLASIAQQFATPRELSIVTSAARELDAKDAEIARLRAALEVFASLESWDIVRRDYGNNAFICLRVFVQPMNPDGTDTIDYPAEFARKALEGTS